MSSNQQKLIGHLEQYGWHEKRNVSTSNWNKELEARGLSTSSFSNEVLSKFGGLYIPRASSDGMSSDVTFDPVIASDAYDPGVILDYQEDLTPSILTPIALLREDYGALLCTEDERLFIIHFEAGFFSLGKRNIFDSLDFLLFNYGDLPMFCDQDPVK